MNTILTTEEFKKFYPSSSLTDEQIQMYCQIITEYIHELAGVSLEEGEITETLFGNDNRIIYLKKRPVKEIKSFESNRTNINDIAINSDNNGIERLKGIFYKGQDIYEHLASNMTFSERVKITYIGGYKYPDGVPMMLKYAAAGLINSYVDEMENGNLKSYSRDDVSYTFKDSIERNRQFNEIIWKFI